MNWTWLGRGAGPQLLAAVDAAMPGRLDLDLSAVSYLASAGVGLLLERLRRARAGRRPTARARRREWPLPASSNSPGWRTALDGTD